MSSQWLASQISRATGIPEPDVLAQIIPHLSSLTSKSQAEQYLYELCGTSPAVLSFVSTYINTRFPPAAAPPPRSHSAAPSRGGSPYNSRPSTPSGGQRSNANRGREVDLAPLPPTAKSRPVRKLERLMARLDKMSFGTDFAKQEQDDEDHLEPEFEELMGCFCQARLHPLSHYTPMCPSCGLILCGLQLPHLPCPSCHRPLLNAVSRERVKRKLRDEIDDVLAKEQAERDRLEDERRQLLEAQSGGGIFPTLGGVQVKASKGDNATRRVLTIGNKSTASKGKGKTGATPAAATLTTYRPKIPLSQAAQDALLDREERKKLGRVERPFSFDLEPPDVRAQRERRAKLNEEWRKKEGRFWGDIDFEPQDLAIRYIPAGQAVKEEARQSGPSDERAKPVIPGAEIKAAAKPTKTKKKKTGDPQNLEMERINLSKEEQKIAMDLKGLELKKG